MNRKLVTTLVLAVLALPPVYTQAPGDTEIRTGRDPATGDSLTTLVLLPSNSQGPLPIRMGITKIQRAKVASGSQSDMRIDVDMRMFVGQPDYGEPQLQMTLDRGTKAMRQETPLLEPGANARAQTQISFVFSQAALGRLAAATTVDGKVFGVEFTLTSRQLQAIKQFAR